MAWSRLPAWYQPGISLTFPFALRTVHDTASPARRVSHASRTTANTASAWETVSAVPPLDPGTVHVWQEPLAVAGDRPWMSPFPLSAGDAARAERFRVAERRHAFTRGRLLARHLVARYLGRPEPGVELSVHANGKPFVVTAPDDPPLEISLSHSSDVLLVAVSLAGEVGVDAERIDPAIDHQAIARRFFAAEETAAIAACDPREREAAFFRCWTRKEALVKALGDGLARSLAAFAVQVTGEGESPLLRVPPEWDRGDAWRLHDLAPGDGYAGALAVRGTGVVVRRLRWAP